jgi:hypothetical protein
MVQSITVRSFVLHKNIFWSRHQDFTVTVTVRLVVKLTAGVSHKFFTVSEIITANKQGIETAMATSMVLHLYFQPRLDIRNSPAPTISSKL